MERSIHQLIIYQADNGSLELKTDISEDTICANLDQIANLFNRDKSVISRHIKNIFTQQELDKEVVVAFFATTTQHGAIIGKSQTNQVGYYNLEMILSIGYRVNSKVAKKFRQWATQTLKQHINKGYTINQKRLEQNKAQFLQTLEDLKILLENNQQVEAKDILSLIPSFSSTWFSLDSYYKILFPQAGTLEEIKASAAELQNDLQKLNVYSGHVDPPFRDVDPPA